VSGKSQHQITIVQLSKELGLSIATISSVLNNRHIERRISPKTVKRVQEAARKIGYFPNISARQLRAYRSENHPLTIAIITSFQAPLPLISVAISALENVAQELEFKDIRYILTVDMFEAGQLRKLPGLLDGSRFNAAIIANTIPEDDKFLAENILTTPTVFIGRDIPNYFSVRELSDMAGKQAADILFASGSSKPAILMASMLTQTTKARLKGFLEDSEKLSGLVPQEIIAEGFREKDGYEAMRQFLEAGKSIDGLYTITDSLAVGAYHAIKEQKLKIPDDVSVISTGDNPVAPYMDPPLSTFTRSQVNMHEEAARLLLRQITGDVTQPTQIVVPVIPVLRKSTRRGSITHLKEAF
jgi:LacI family transcriptional regulator